MDDIQEMDKILGLAAFLLFVTIVTALIGWLFLL